MSSSQIQRHNLQSIQSSKTRRVHEVSLVQLKQHESTSFFSTFFSDSPIGSAVIRQSSELKLEDDQDNCSIRESQSEAQKSADTQPSSVVELTGDAKIIDLRNGVCVSANSIADSLMRLDAGIELKRNPGEQTTNPDERVNHVHFTLDQIVGIIKGLLRDGEFEVYKLITARIENVITGYNNNSPLRCMHLSHIYGKYNLPSREEDAYVYCYNCLDSGAVNHYKTKIGKGAEAKSKCDRVCDLLTTMAGHAPGDSKDHDSRGYALTIVESMVGCAKSYTGSVEFSDALKAVVDTVSAYNKHAVINKQDLISLPALLAVIKNGGISRGLFNRTFTNSLKDLAYNMYCKLFECHTDPKDLARIYVVLYECGFQNILMEDFCDSIKNLRNTFGDADMKLVLAYVEVLFKTLNIFQQKGDLDFSKAIRKRIQDSNNPVLQIAINCFKSDKECPGFAKYGWPEFKYLTKQEGSTLHFTDEGFKELTACLEVAQGDHTWRMNFEGEITGKSKRELLENGQVQFLYFGGAGQDIMRSDLGLDCRILAGPVLTTSAPAQEGFNDLINVIFFSGSLYIKDEAAIGYDCQLEDILNRLARIYSKEDQSSFKNVLHGIFVDHKTVDQILKQSPQFKHLKSDLEQIQKYAFYKFFMNKLCRPSRDGGFALEQKKIFYVAYSIIWYIAQRMSSIPALIANIGLEAHRPSSADDKKHVDYKNQIQDLIRNTLRAYAIDRAVKETSPDSSVDVEPVREFFLNLGFMW